MNPLPSFAETHPQNPSIAGGAAVAIKESSRYYRPELDVLRCFAFVMVFNHHLVPTDFYAKSFQLNDLVAEAGAGGVCLFFMLSAFLITELLLREKERTGTVAIRSFYVRRVLRIWPLYLLILLLSLVLPRFLPALHHPSVGVVASFLFFSGNWSTVLFGWPHSALLGPLWSISVEEQFYLVWPALVLRWGTKGIARVAMVALTLAWTLDFVLPAMHVNKQPGLWCNSISQFQFFAIGGILALALHKRSYAPVFYLRILAGALGIGMLLVAAIPFHFLESVPPMRIGQTLCGYLCLDAGVLLVFLAILGAKVPKLCSPLIYLGKISYGLYVFHLATMFLVERVLIKHLHLQEPPTEVLILRYCMTAAITFVLASTSYRFYEKPFLRFKDRFTLVASRAA